MRIPALALTFLAGLSAPALADSTEVLRKALSGIPQIATTNPDPMQAFFLDVKAWRAVTQGQDAKAVAMRLNVGRSIDPVQTIRLDNVDGWGEKAGVPLSEVSYFAGFGNPPQSIAYWGLADEAAATRMIDNLKAREFTAVKGPVRGILGNSAAPGIDIKKRDVLSPWRGPTGRNNFALQVDNAVIQAPAPQAMAVLAKVKPSAADNPAVAASLDGLGAGVEAGKGQILQAMVISPAFGMRAGDPSRLLTKKPDEAKRMLEEQQAKAAQGIPPYLGGIISDVEVDGRPAMVVSLAYPDCGVADRAVADMQARWSESMAEAVKADVSGRSFSKGDGLCAAVVSFVGEKNDAGSNMVLTQAMNRTMRGNFPVLQIAMPQR